MEVHEAHLEILRAVLNPMLRYIGWPEPAKTRGTQVTASQNTVEVSIHGLVLLDLLSVAVLILHVEVTQGRRAMLTVGLRKLCPKDSFAHKDVERF